MDKIQALALLGIEEDEELSAGRIEDAWHVAICEEHQSVEQYRLINEAREILLYGSYHVSSDDGVFGSTEDDVESDDVDQLGSAQLNYEIGRASCRERV